MREFAIKALVFFIPIAFAFICFGLSDFVMDGYIECSGRVDFISIPPEPSYCASDRTLLTRDFFWFLGIILIFAPLAAALIIEWRKEFNKEVEIEPLKISEQ